MIIRDLEDKIVPLGKSSVQANATFFDSALPAWITAGTGATISYDLPHQSSGGMRITSGTAQNAEAFVNIFPSGIAFGANFKEVIFYFEAFGFSNVNTRFVFEFLNSARTHGFKISDPSADETTYVETLHPTGGTTSTNASYQIMRNDEYKRKRNFCVRIQWDGTVAFGEYSGDIEHYVFVKKYPTTQLDMNQIFLPRVGIVNLRTDTNTTSVRFRRVGVTLVSN